MGNLRRRLCSGLVALVLATGGLNPCAPELLASTPSVERANPSAGPAIALSALPPEAWSILALIRKNGPFPYPKDGIVFGNREHLLPLMPYGYYHEYTVPPSAAADEADESAALRQRRSRDRGIRRIVCGGQAAGVACYYTADHYTSFQRIVG
jgi:ribonuclease T1